MKSSVVKTSVILAACGVVLTMASGGATAQTPRASAEIKDATGRVVGTATFSQVVEGVQVSGTVRGLPPGPHGIHVHAVGQCEPPFTTAGGHFNPTNRKHGLKSPEGAHVGDLPNLTVAADGTGILDAVARGATLGAGPASLLDPDGSSLVIHAGPDDDATDPAGSSGDRIACGVLVAAALSSQQPTALPKTGGLADVTPILAGVGALLAAGGFALRRMAARRRDSR